MASSRRASYPINPAIPHILKALRNWSFVPGSWPGPYYRETTDEHRCTRIRKDDRINSVVILSQWIVRMVTGPRIFSKVSSCLQSVPIRVHPWLTIRLTQPEPLKFRFSVVSMRRNIAPNTFFHAANNATTDEHGCTRIRKDDRTNSVVIPLQQIIRMAMDPPVASEV